MGHALSLQTALEVARATLPTWFESLLRAPTRDDCDRRLRRFGARVVELADIRLLVEGTERVPGERAFIYMSNHQSHIDIPVLYATVPARSLRMVAKRELTRVPLWGRSLRAAGMIVIDRSDREAAVASLRAASEQIAQGVSIWIAPEGTRSRTGALGPLKKGGFHLALDTGTPIAPVAISGTRHILPPGASSMERGRPVRVRFGEPMPVAGRRIESLMAEVADFLACNVET